MKFQIEVTAADSTPWLEDYDDAKLNTEAEISAWATMQVAAFNAGLRPGEKARTFTGKVLILGDGAGGSHSWLKTNLMTLSDPRWGSHDNVQCRYCKITGRRYGLDRIQRSTQYRAKKFAFCNPPSGNENPK